MILGLGELLVLLVFLGLIGFGGWTLWNYLRRDVGTSGVPALPPRDRACLASILTEPRPDECVLCYVDRMLDAFGCDTTLRWARRWRDLRRPRATGLERRLESRGGFCDCEIFLNGWTLREDLWVPDDED